MREQIRDRKSGDQVGWVENGRDVYSLKTRKIFATVGENGNLYGPDGEFLRVHIENLDGGRGLLSTDSAALKNFKKLAGF